MNRILKWLRLDEVLADYATKQDIHEIDEWIEFTIMPQLHTHEDLPDPPADKSKLWQFTREDGSQQTKLFKLVDKGNGKVGIAGEFGYNEEWDIIWKVDNGNVVEELSIEEEFPGYGLASNTDPAASWDDLKYVKLTKYDTQGGRHSKKGLIVRHYNSGEFTNVETGEVW